jgi:hypothetical protein
MRKKTETEDKRCMECGVVMKRGYTRGDEGGLESLHDWGRRKFCSRKCSGRYYGKIRHEQYEEGKGVIEDE